MRQVRPRFLMAMAAAALVGCGPPTAAGGQVELQGPGDAQCALTQENGMRMNGLVLNGTVLNGIVLNGIVLNGIVLNGIVLNGIRLNGVDLNGIVLNGIRLNGAELNGIRLNDFRLNGMRLNGPGLNDLRLNGAALGLPARDVSLADFTLGLSGSELVARHGDLELRGQALVGAQLGFEQDGHDVRLIIDGLEEDGDIMRYTMSVQVDDSDPMPLCTNAAGEPDPSVRVVPLAGAWDEVTGGKDDSDGGLLTLGCEGGALTKCVDMGYVPWRSHSVCDDDGCREISLEAHHQACTRMVRADYCGDGTPHTVDGTLINLYDGFGIQLDEGGDGFALEAEWTTGGARCLASPRLAKMRSGGCVSSCVERLMADQDRSCGDVSRFTLRDDPWSPEQTLLMSEHQR